MHGNFSAKTLQHCNLSQIFFHFALDISAKILYHKINYLKSNYLSCRSSQLQMERRYKKMLERRAPYRICTKRPSAQAGRDICLALHDERSATLAVQRFAEYLDHRNDKIDLDKEM